MFIIRMQGGLGNQIFIFLFYMSLCKQYGEKNVSIDLSSYKRFHAHTGYILEDVFDILPLNKCDLRDAKKYSTEIIYTDRLGYLSNHINYIGKIVDYYNTFIAPRKKK